MLNDADRLVSEDDLRRIYKQPAKAVVAKTFPHLDPHSRRYLELSPFFCLGSSQEGGMGDVSPRGALGLVIWIDNQYMIVTPQGRLGHGLMEFEHEQYLEVARLAIES